VDSLPVDPNSEAYKQTIGLTKNLHPDFGSGLYDGNPIGIPYVLVPGNQARVNITFDYDGESDPGPYPIPPNPPIEGGDSSTGDRHILIIDKDNCKLYEIYSAYPQTDGSWHAGSGAIYDLKSNTLRPDGWTSADAAGLPILPGLVRYDEVATGAINHAIRLTVPDTRNTYIWPARHKASSKTDTKYPPMGQRFRLRGNFDVSSYAPDAVVILKALKKYGMILADNGSAWFISGVPDERWDNDVLNTLKQVKGSDFEAVDESSLMIDPNSGQARQTQSGVDYAINNDGLAKVYQEYPGNNVIIEINGTSGGSIYVYNILGSPVKNMNIDESTGKCRIVWDGRDYRGSEIVSGVYFFVIKLGSDSYSGKFIYSETR
jgi:hypothetical protein